MVSFIFAFTSNYRVLAQSPEDLETYGATINETDIELNQTPQNPQAFQDVRFLLTSNLVDLNKQKITWFINGVLQSSGIGVRELTTKTGANSTQQNIQVVIEVDGKIIRKQSILNPRDTVLLWEAIDSYVPPFYQGKKLPGRESRIKVVVNPYQQSGGPNPRPEQGVYIWSRNGNTVNTASGYGKDFFIFKHNRIRGTEEVSVSVSDINNSISGNQSIIVPFFNPEIIIYTSNPSLGIKQPLRQNSFFLAEGQRKIIAEPFFFSVTNNNPDNLDITWTMNNRRLDSKSQDLVISSGSQSGTAQIGVVIENLTETLQSGRSFINVLFRRN